MRSRTRDLAPHPGHTEPGRPGARRLAAALLAVVLATAAAGATAETVSAEWAQSWQDDLRFLARELPRTHPDPFTVLDRAEFEARVDELIEAAPTMSHEALVVELARLVAALGDGHTRVTLPLPEGAGIFLGHSKTPAPHVPGLVFDLLPLRLVLLDDGLMVSAAPPEHAAAVGAEVLRIGDKTAAEAIALVSPIVHHDNAHQLAYQLPDYLVLPDVLAAVGVTPAEGGIELTLAPPSGDPFTVRLDPAGGGWPAEWVELEAVAGIEPPLHRRHNERKFWFEHLPDERAVYCQYNEVGNEEDETLAEFTERLLAFVDERSVDKLILDLRRNRGGNNGLNKALLHGLIRSRRLQRPGSLFVITGGGTFSAALMFSVDLARHTQAVFVGSPTGSSPNHFGDSRKLRLPRTGLTVRVSTLYWQYADPRDDRETIQPHLPVAATIADARAGRDRALETILRPGPELEDDAAWAGTWRGRMSPWRWTFDFTVELERGEAGWTGTIDLPELGIAAEPLREISVGGGEIGFVVVLGEPGRRYDFRGRSEGQRIYGTFSYTSDATPFVLFRP